MAVRVNRSIAGRVLHDLESRPDVFVIARAVLPPPASYLEVWLVRSGALRRDLDGTLCEIFLRHDDAGQLHIKSEYLDESPLARACSRMSAEDAQEFLSAQCRSRLLPSGGGA